MWSLPRSGVEPVASASDSYPPYHQGSPVVTFLDSIDENISIMILDQVGRCCCK